VSTIEFDVSFEDIDANDAEFFINDEDVTSSFTITGSTAIASIRANTFPAEKNRLSVQTPNASASGIFFVDRSPPEFHITNVSPSIIFPGSNVTVQGYLSDLSGIGPNTGKVYVEDGGSSLREIASIPISYPDKSFEVSFVMEFSPDGELLESAAVYFSAYDTIGHRGIDGFGSSLQRTQLVKTKINQQVFDSTINPAINEIIEDTDIGSFINNPVADGDKYGFGYDVDITNFDISGITVDLQPTSSGGNHLIATVDVDYLDFRIWSSVGYQPPCIPFTDICFPRIGVYVPSGLNDASVSGTVAVKLAVMDNGWEPKLEVVDINPNLNISGDFDIIDWGPLDYLPGVSSLEDFIFWLVGDYVANLVGDKIADKAAKKVNKLLELIPTNFSPTVRGKSVNFYVNNATITSDSSGLVITIDEASIEIPFGTRASNLAKEIGPRVHQKGVSLPGFGSRTPNGQLFDVGLSLDWDYLNAALYSAHQVGIDRYSLDVDGADIPGVGGYLDDYELSIQVKPLSTPFMGIPMPKNDNALASLLANDVEVMVNYRDKGASTYELLTGLTANARVNIGVGVSGRKIKINIDDDPTVSLQSVEASGAALQIDEEIIQKILDYAVPAVFPRIGDLVEEIELPSVEGYNLHILKIERDADRFFKIYANLCAPGALCTIPVVLGPSDLSGVDLDLDLDLEMSLE